MQLVPEPTGERQTIQSWSAGGFTISGVRHAGSVLVLPDRTLPWQVGGEPDLASLDALRALDPRPELLLFGGGARMMIPAAELRAGLKLWRIAVDPMTTPAACRTFNILAAERRRVAAALIALGN
jgi:uncharacterized protein